MATHVSRPRANSDPQLPRWNASTRPRVVARADDTAICSVRLPEASRESAPRLSVWVVGATAVPVLVLAITLALTLALAGFVVLADVPRFFADISNPILAIAAAIICVQAGIIAVLVVSRSRRRVTEMSFRENEEAMALAASSANIGLWSW